MEAHSPHVDTQEREGQCAVRETRGHTEAEANVSPTEGSCVPLGSTGLIQPFHGPGLREIRQCPGSKFPFLFNGYRLQPAALVSPMNIEARSLPRFKRGDLSQSLG